MVRKSFFLLLVVMCAVAFAAVNVSSRPDDDDDDDHGGGRTILKWQSMAAVTAPFFSITVPFSPIDGVGGGNARWTIERGWGKLKANGKLEVHTRGLLLPDPPFNGQNTVPFFRALVKCRSVDASGAAIVTETFSENYPASLEGDSDLKTKITLPSPCYAPTLFIMHFAAPRWFATLGDN